MNEKIFLEIIAEISKIFNETKFTSPNLIELKEENERDAVTSLDLYIHKKVEDFIREHKLIDLYSEESKNLKNIDLVLDKKIILLDPLDGSLNYAVGLDFYCSLIAYINHGILEFSGICIPSIKQIVTYNFLENSFISSKPIVSSNKEISGPTYLAYGSSSGQLESDIQFRMTKIINQFGNGIFRLGSAGYGAYLAMIGKLSGFVGINIKCWDILPILSIARYMGHEVYYRLIGDSVDIVFSSRNNLLKPILEEFEKYGPPLNFHELDTSLDLTNV